MAKDNGHPLANARANGGGPLNPQPDLTDLFIKLPSELVNLVGDGKLSINAAWLYVLLLSCINHKRGDAKVWPSRRWLAERMRMSQVRAIDRYINELENAGLLDRDRRRNGRVNDTNVYTLRLVHQGGSAQQSTTPRPGKTAMSAGQGVVHGSALPSAQESTRGSAQESTGVVHSCAPELDEVELDEVQPDERTISLSSSSSRGSPPAPREPDGRERDEDDLEKIGSANAPVRRLLAEHCGITDAALADQIIGYVESGNNVRTAGFWVVAVRNGTIHTLVDEARDAITNPPPADGWTPQSPADHSFARAMTLARKYDRLDGTGRVETRDPFKPANHRASSGYQPYRDPADLSVYDQPL